VGGLLPSGIPFGVMTGIFLAVFEKCNRGFVRSSPLSLTGVPSIIIGVFAYGVIVLTFKEFSAVAGGFALAILMLPIVVPEQETHSHSSTPCLRSLRRQPPQTTFASSLPPPTIYHRHFTL